MIWSQVRIAVVGRGDSPATDSATCYLAAQGASVDATPDLAEALMLLNAAAGDYTAVVLIAGDFPLDQLGPLRAIRCLYPRTAIVACADATGRAQLVAALQLGADATLTAPFYRSELVTLIERIVTRIEGAPPLAAEVVDARAAAEAVTVLESLAAAEPAPAEVDVALPVVVAEEGSEFGVREESGQGSGVRAQESPPTVVGGNESPPMAIGGSEEPSDLSDASDLSDLSDVPDAAAEEVSPEPPAPAPEEAFAEEPADEPPFPPEPTADALAEPPEPEPAAAARAGLLSDSSEAAADETAAPDSTRHSPHATLSPARVLLVDHERLFRELLADILREQGFYVADAADEKQALWCLADEDYDAIVLDASTNGGGAGLASFRQACPDTPVVVITNLASRGEETEYRAAGAAACIGKPFDLTQLLDVLGAVMQSPAASAHPLLSPEEINALLAPEEPA